MSLRTQVINLSCLLGMVTLFVVSKPSFADPLSSLAPLKERLMNVKPNAFVATNVRELVSELVAKFPEGEPGEHPERKSEYEAYCEALYEAAWALDVLENHRAEEELDDFEDRLLDVDILVSKAEAHKNVYEFGDEPPITDGSSFVEDVDEQPLSSHKQDLPHEFNEEAQMISELKEKLSETAPSFEGVDIFDVEQWRTQKEAELELATRESAAPMQDLNVLQAKVDYEYALYCETASKASETLNTLEAQLRHASLHPLDESFDDGLYKAPVLVSQVEARKLAYSDALDSLQTLREDTSSLVEDDLTSEQLQQDLPHDRNQARQAELHQLRIDLLLTAPRVENVYIFDIEQWRAKKEAELELATKESAAPMQDLNVLEAKVDYECALYCETASKASEALDTLEAQFLQASVEPLNESFDDGLSDARDLVSQVADCKLSYADAVEDVEALKEEKKNLSPQPNKESSTFQKLKSRIFSGW